MRRIGSSAAREVSRIEISAMDEAQVSSTIAASHKDLMSQSKALVSESISDLKGAMSPNTHARANENKLEKDSPTFSSCVGDFGRLFLSV